MRFLTILVATIAAAGQAFSAASITPRLETALSEASINQTHVRALIILADRVDVRTLDQDLYARKASMNERAFTVITSLQAKASETQGSLLSYLGSKTSSEVTNYKSFWVVNMIQVEAEPNVIREIAQRADVDELDLDAELALDRPVDQNLAPESIPNGSEPGLRAINAHLMWELGFTGEGRIVMGIDTGVNGNHPALNYKWRGTHVPAEQAWFDPEGFTTFPNDCDGHGTHTIGTMNGLDPATNDTVGVAPGAEWIAAKTICLASPHTSRSIAAFEWAMDPDEDPKTIDDMPDAIGNSWWDPSATDCENGSYRLTWDAVEAAGIAVVFSAGNSGPGGQSITVPKNTNTDLVNVWATGAVDANNNIASFSSRGPSTCGGSGSLLIKPEACAPGVSIRSSYGTGYSFLSGTSMAAPHVAGAIALLRQAYPQFTGHELKMALYNTAVDLGTTGEDNTYGMGIIDVYAAFLSLGAPNPPADVTVYSDYLTPTTIELNWTDPTNLVNGDTLLTSEYKIYISRDGETIDSLDAGVQQYLDEDLTEGQEYEYGVWTQMTTSSLASSVVELVWNAGGSPQPATPLDFSLTGTNDEITLDWTNPSTNVDGTPMIDFGGINLYQDDELVQTFARATTDTGSADSESYSPANPGPYSWHLTAVDDDLPQNESPPTEALLTPLSLPFGDHFGTEGLPNPVFWMTVNGDINDRASNPPSSPYSMNLNGHPIGGDTLETNATDLTSFAGTGVLLSYHYQPQGTGNAPETGDSLMVFFLNDLGSWVKVMAYPGTTLQPFAHEVIDIESAGDGGSTFLHSQFQLRFVSEGGAGATANDDWFVDNVYLGIPSAAIATSVTSLVMDSTSVGSSSSKNFDLFNIGSEELDVSDVISTDPPVFSVDVTSFSLLPGGTQSIEVTFSPDEEGLTAASLLIAGNTTPDTFSVAVSGVGELTTGAGGPEEGLPREFSVSRNFPNPFNPSTTIKYELPEASRVDLAIYSLLGSRIRTLISSEMEAGYHQARWDGKNDSGVPVTSGVYIYRFIAGDYSLVQKMILLK